MTIDAGRLDALFRRFMSDLGAALVAPLVVLGERLGLYRALEAAGPTGLTAAELAAATGINEDLFGEWLTNQAAAGYLEYDAQQRRFRLAPEYAAALVDAEALRTLRRAFLAVIEASGSLDRLERAYRTGQPVRWPEGRDPGPLLRPLLRYESLAAMTTEWVPALAGVDTRLRAGGAAAELGCGDGAITSVLAAAYPRSIVVGFDPDGRNVAEASARAGRPSNADFRIGSFTTFDMPEDPGRNGAPGARGGYDLVVSVDTYHAEPDPIAAAEAVRRRLRPDGVWMIVEPVAGPGPDEAVGPCGRLLTGAAATGCLPEWGVPPSRGALGARAGESRLRRAVTAGGFGRVRPAVETAWHLVLEARL
jgi:SAM-dependent methyltransferase